MSDLVGNPEDRFSHNKAQMLGYWENYGTLCISMKWYDCRAEKSEADARSHRDLNFFDIYRDSPNAGKVVIILYVARMVFRLLEGSIYLIVQGIARTQSPTLINCVPELPTFGVIAGVNPTEVQWKGLFLGEPPC